jgi:uncharacterized membrane protein SpoIIM required for sporulation
MSAGQENFVAQYTGHWQRFEAMLDALDRGERAGADFPGLYRQMCQHLALARDRGYSVLLTGRLNTLVLRGHQRLYGARRESKSKVIQFIAAGFPAAVRAEAKLVWLAAALLFGPALAIGIATHLQPELVFSMLEPAEAREYEEMYRPDGRIIGRLQERASSGDFMMFGFYIWNNVRIAFQCFASGFLLGLGPIFFLVFNGLQMGVVAGHLTNHGYSETFYSFVIGHGAFELTAIVLSGAAGLRIGSALLFPGRRRRADTLKDAARRAVPIIYGTTGMLVIAGLIETFWSSSGLIPAPAKFAMGAVYWAAVFTYFLTRGRSHAA